MLAVSNITFNDISIPDYISCTLHLLADEMMIRDVDKRDVDLDILIHFIEITDDDNIVGVEIKGKPHAGLQSHLFNVTKEDVSECLSLRDICTVVVNKWYEKYMPSTHKRWTIVSIDRILPVDEKDKEKYFKILKEFGVE